jgi:endonuclease YncB( thermonuclease family)
MRSVARRRTLFFLLAYFLIGTFAGLALADSNPAKVLVVKDGDTITVVVNSGRQTDVRLEGIDAPEHGQPFADASKEHLNNLVLGKDVSLDCTGEDEYSRLVCKVLLQNG